MNHGTCQWKRLILLRKRSTPLRYFQERADRPHLLAVRLQLNVGPRLPFCHARTPRAVGAACDSDALRARMAEQGAWANVKPMPNRKQVLAFSPFLYKYRNLVERFFSKIKHFRVVATRYDKDPDNFLASVKLAVLRVWLRTF